MTPEEIWRGKSDEELLAASTRLAEYTEIGQRTILSEIRRRDLGVLTDASIDCGESDGINPAVATAQFSHRSRSYVARLWRGEISLPLTYWVWGILFNTLMRILMIALLLTNRNLVLAVSVVAVYLAYCALIVVAIWRSSARYTGRRIWRDLARFSLVLLLITWVADRLLGE